MINYSDEEPHTATVAEHAEQLTHDLSEFCATNSNANDYMAAGAFIKEIGAILEALADKNKSDVITLTWRDWGGFTASDEEV